MNLQNIKGNGEEVIIIRKGYAAGKNLQGRLYRVSATAFDVQLSDGSFQRIAANEIASCSPMPTAA